MCRKSLCHKRQPNSSGTFFMPSEQQPFPDFIENQKKDVTGILIISDQSTSTVSNSIRHAILSKKYTERVKRNWNTQAPHTVSRRLLPSSTLRKSDSACSMERSKGIHLHHPPGIPCSLISYDRFHRKEPCSVPPKCLCSHPVCRKV